MPSCTSDFVILLLIFHLTHWDALSSLLTSLSDHDTLAASNISCLSQHILTKCMIAGTIRVGQWHQVRVQGKWGCWPHPAKRLGSCARWCILPITYVAALLLSWKYVVRIARHSLRGRTRPSASPDSLLHTADDKADRTAVVRTVLVGLCDCDSLPRHCSYGHQARTWKCLAAWTVDRVSTVSVRYQILNRLWRVVFQTRLQTIERVLDVLMRQHRECHQSATDQPGTWVGDVCLWQAQLRDFPIDGLQKTYNKSIFHTTAWQAMLVKCKVFL